MLISIVLGAVSAVVDRGQGFQLPSYIYKLHKQSFAVNCLFTFLK